IIFFQAQIKALFFTERNFLYKKSIMTIIISGF
ncbi:hypothetical protein EVA_18880, partial [gut metagenome]